MDSNPHFFRILCLLTRERRRVKGRSTRVKVCKRSGTVLTGAGHRVDPRVAVLPWQLTAVLSENKGVSACRFSARHLFCGAHDFAQAGCRRYDEYPSGIELPQTEAAILRLIALISCRARVKHRR